MQAATLTAVTVLLVLFAQLSLLNALDLENAKERPCPGREMQTVKVDLDWFSSVKTWYYPLMSRVDLYWTALDMIGNDAEKLHEDELYYDGCFRAEFNDKGDIEMTGFHGKKSTLRLEQDEGQDKYKMFTKSGEFLGTGYDTLTDNKTFVFIATCSQVEGDQMSWGVMSTMKELPEKTVNLIHEHAKSLGFSSDYFTGIRYDQCDKKDKRFRSNEETFNSITAGDGDASQ